MSLFACTDPEIIQCIKQSLDKPNLIVTIVCRPGSSQDNQFDFADWMSRLRIRIQSRRYLLIGVEPQMCRAKCSGFSRDVTLGHAHVDRAKHALPWAGERFGQNRYGGDSRQRASRLFD